MRITIRKIQIRDAAKFNALKKRIEFESPYMLFNKGENQNTDESQIDFIRVLNSKNSTKHLFVAELNNELVGFIGLMGTRLSKKAHIREIAMGVLRVHSGKGVGRKLMEHAIDFAAQNQIKRLELTVIAENKNAMKLYQKMGFTKEGLKKQSIFLNGRYVDEEVYGYVL